MSFTNGVHFGPNPEFFPKDKPAKLTSNNGDNNVKGLFSFREKIVDSGKYFTHVFAWLNEHEQSLPDDPHICFNLFFEKGNPFEKKEKILISGIFSEICLVPGTFISMVIDCTFPVGDNYRKISFVTHMIDHYKFKLYKFLEPDISDRFWAALKNSKVTPVHLNIHCYRELPMDNLLHLKLPNVNNSFWQNLEKANFSDLVIKFNGSGKEYKTHKCILAAQSDHFAKLLSSEMAEKDQSIIHLKDDHCPEKIFDIFMNYFYSKKIEEFTGSFDTTMDTLQLANKYLVTDLTNICLSVLKSWEPTCLTIKQALNLLSLAQLDIYSNDRENTLEDIAINSLKSRSIKDLKESEDFNNFFEEETDRKLLLKISVNIGSAAEKSE